VRILVGSIEILKTPTLELSKGFVALDWSYAKIFCSFAPARQYGDCAKSENSLIGKSIHHAASL
jgi:hypothetical protein